MTAPTCSWASRRAGEPVAGTAPRADVWIVVEHHQGWGDAPLARSAHGVRVVMAHPVRGHAGAAQVWVAHAGPIPVLRRGIVSEPDEVADWDLAAIAAGEWAGWGEQVPEPLILICANGRRDRCCGQAGGRLARELDHGPHHGTVLTSTHLGGHRFAPTAVLLPWGVAHGRLDLAAARDVLEGARHATSPTDTLRGHSTLEPAAQVAEIQARRLTGYRGLAPLAVELDQGADRDTLTARVTPPDGGPHLPIHLERRVVEVVASCGTAPAPTPRWVVVG